MQFEIVIVYKKKAQSKYANFLSKIFKNYEQMLIKICSGIWSNLILSFILFVVNDLEISESFYCGILNMSKGHRNYEQNICSVANTRSTALTYTLYRKFPYKKVTKFFPVLSIGIWHNSVCYLKSWMIYREKPTRAMMQLNTIIIDSNV